MKHSETQRKLPIIDLNNEENLKPGTSSWLSTCNKARNALEEYGSFVVLYDKVPQKVNNAMLLALEELFALPTETKMLNYSDIPAFGYIGKGDNRPLHESLGLEDSTNLEAIQKFANLMWPSRNSKSDVPSGNSKFSEVVHSYAKEMSKIREVLTRMVLESYGLEKHYDSHLNSSSILMRVNKYEPANANHNIGVSAHTDMTFLTILHQINSVQGFELKPRDGSWISVDIPPSSFVVNAGDAMLAWSNGRIHSAVHRVTMTNEEKRRYSIAMFTYQKGTFHVPEELVDEDHPLQFKSFDQLGYYRFATVDQALQNEDRIKAYCGV